MMKRRNIAIAVAALALFLLYRFVSYVLVEPFQRHYAFSGYPDRITLFLYSGEDADLLYSNEDIDSIPTSDYKLILNGSDANYQGPIKDHGDCYSLTGDYGTYYFTLTWQGRTADFYLENVNDWWRTVILLRLRDDGRGLEQINCVYNTNPPGMEVFMIDWNDEQAV